MVKPLKTEFALTDHAIPRSGLFRCHSRTKVDSRLSASRFKIEWKGSEYTYVSPFLLDARDWKTFVTLCALAGVCQKIEESDDDVRHRLQLSGWYRNRQVARVETSQFQLLAEMGRNHAKSDYGFLRESLSRLSHVTISVRTNEGRVIGGCSLLSYEHDKDLSKIVVVLAPLASQKLLNLSDQYLKLSMIELRSLRREPAILLHAHLASRIKADQSMKLNIDDLAQGVFGQPTDANQVRDRRRTVKGALRDLEQIGWKIDGLTAPSAKHCVVTRARLS